MVEFNNRRICSSIIISNGISDRVGGCNYTTPINKRLKSMEAEHKSVITCYVNPTLFIRPFENKRFIAINQRAGRFKFFPFKPHNKKNIYFSNPDKFEREIKTKMNRLRISNDSTNVTCQFESKSSPAITLKLT